MINNVDPAMPAVIGVPARRLALPGGGVRRNDSAAIATTVLLAAMDPKLPRLAGD